MKDSIIIHHSAVIKEENQASSINAYHKKLHFPLSSRGSYIGYDWLIERSGAYNQYRAYTDIGAHTYTHDKNWNETAIGICLAGDFTKQSPNPEQLESLYSLTEKLMKMYNIQPANIYEHRDIKNTQCPGAFGFKEYLWGRMGYDKFGKYSQDNRGWLSSRYNYTKRLLKRLNRAKNTILIHVKERLLKRLYP